MASLVQRLWPMLLGILAGTVVLTRLDPRWCGVGLAATRVAYAGFALVSPGLRVPRRAESWLTPMVGLVTGVITGATGVFVLPAVPHLQALALDKDALAQALGLSFTVSILALALGLWWHGGVVSMQVGMSSLTVVPAPSGMWPGQRIRRHIADVAFRRCCLALLLIMGLERVSRVWR